MSSAVDKATKLLALATSPNENEARTAASLAAKVIRENKLILLSPDDPRLSGRSADPFRDWPPRWPGREPPRSEPPPRRPNPPPPPPPPPKSSVDNEPVKMSAKHPGFCRVCRQTFEPGTRIFWKKGVGTSHQACGWKE